MKTGYEAELGARQSEIETAKVVLESLYMTKDTDAQIDGDEGLQQKYNSAIGSANLACNALGDTVKTVRLAVETCINLYVISLRLDFLPMTTQHMNPRLQPSLMLLFAKDPKPKAASKAKGKAKAKAAA